MQYSHIDKMYEGWWIGDFTPSVLRTGLFEVAYKQHQKGEDWPTHYQEEATEYNLLLHGKMVMTNGKQIRGKHRLLSAGDIFIVEPGEITKPMFLEDCEVMVVKTPSIPLDKKVVHV